MLKWVALFVLVPTIELALLIEVGQRIGTLATLGLIAVTGVVGASLARTQGLGVIGRLQADMTDGRMPADALLDGVLIMCAGAVLLTPGLLTDAGGFLLLVPAFRGWLKKRVRARLERAVSEGRAHVPFDVRASDAERPPESSGRVIDVESTHEPD
ncbi:MAG: FxsA family protein [bacterium]|nr:FxsA family protein [bacterium]